VEAMNMEIPLTVAAVAAAPALPADETTGQA
jgi:hypothetical protein